MKNLAIYDNGGETFDRITIVFLNEKRKDREGKFLYNAIASSETGAGFFQHTEAMRGKHLGKKITFDKLTPELQARIKNYLQ